MSLLKVYKYPEKVLKQTSKEVSKINKTIADLVKDMFETMYVENGIGLAAPQVGELVRVIVIDVPIINPDNPKDYKSDPLALINPQIKEKSGQIEYEEGCLSCPELIVTVPRAETVLVSYLTPEGEPCSITAQGLKAVCLQHEIDHLNGTLLVDKVSRIERDMYKTKRIRLAKTEDDLAKIL